jgi:alkanesulfonate monooxygenase SsuD/methylene tetrahydromethanopterin reductase-like flavin-dependent oxidoreductase (luciferase family)
MQFGIFSLFDFVRGRQDEVKYLNDVLELSILAEELGYDSVWLGEEHFYSFGICPSPQIFLTAVARETSRIRLGTAISLLPFENPLRKAEDFALLDILSGGRVDFGVGRGIIPQHFRGFQVDPLESRARYEESIQIIRGAWTQDPFEYEGKFWQVPSLSVGPKPLQKPHPPLYRGTLSTQSFEIAGELGDHSLIVPWLSGPHAGVKRRVDLYQKLLDDNGHKGRRRAYIFFLFVDEDHGAAVRDAVETTRAYTQHITDFLSSAKLKEFGEDDPLRAYFEYVLSMPENVEERAVVGTPAECRRRLHELDDEFGGLDQVGFYFMAGGRDPVRARRGIELFAKEVMPEFKQG